MNDCDRLLLNLFEDALLNGPGDIREHLHTLALLACRCPHITEFGTSMGVSTSAFLLARPKKLITYDVIRNPRVTNLEATAFSAGIDFSFRNESTSALTAIEETDLLFIDTLHDDAQLRRELQLHPHVRKYIVLHDTVTFGMRPEMPGRLPDVGGLFFALRSFLQSPANTWRLAVHYPHNNGLTVLERR